MNNRVYYLDAMRGILMMLGVLYHSSLVFSDHVTWIVQSQNTTILASILSNLITSFRMASFFIVSGYFVLLSISKYGPSLFINLRLKRILIPLFTTTITLNVIQSIIAKKDNWETYYFDTGWISHLWFLWNLVFYFIFVYIIFKFKFKAIKTISIKIEKLLIKLSPYLIYFILPLFSIFLMIIGKLFPHDIFGLKIFPIFYYLPFFLFGMILFKNEKILKIFLNINPVVSLLISIVSYSLYQILVSYDGNIFLIMALYFKLVTSWFASSLCFYLFSKFLDKKSKMFYLLSDASFSVYLFHQVLVVAFASILINLGIGGIMGLIILIMLVAIISISIHFLFISKIKLLRFLFNGK